MKKFKRNLLGLVALVIVCGALWFTNGLLGNPFSKMLAGHAAKNYVTEHYADSDFVIEDVNYNFKTTAYHALIKSPSSIDTHFSVTISMLGRVNFDTYENVLNGWNTHQRIAKEYRQIVDNVFSSSQFPLVSDIAFGEIDIIEKDATNRFDEAGYGIKQSELELDKQYDVKELSKTAGHIVFYAQHDEISFYKASEILLTLKEILDKENVPFYSIDFVLEKPRKEYEAQADDITSINTANYLYSDIFEDDLDVRLEKYHMALMDYYAEQDAKETKWNVVI